MVLCFLLLYHQYRNFSFSGSAAIGTSVSEFKSELRYPNKNYLKNKQFQGRDYAISAWQTVLQSYEYD